jgi:uncharacterized membrane-anchored protein YhcB (DUF1043 family)
MGYVVAVLIALAVGFVCGFLVYRNNVKRLQKTEAKLREELSKKGVKVDF